MFKLKILSTLLFVALVLSAFKSQACECKTVSFQQQANVSDVIFRGTVISRIDSASENYYTFTVSQVWKGQSAITITLKTKASPIACGAVFQLGEEYIIYGLRGQTSGCDRNELFRIGSDLSKLNSKDFLSSTNAIGERTTGLVDKDSINQDIPFTSQDLTTHWTELKKTRKDFVVYSPCDGRTPQIKLYKGFIIFINQIDSPDTLRIDKFLHGYSHLLIEAVHKLNGNVKYEINIKWLNKVKAVSYWKIEITRGSAHHTYSMLMFPTNRKNKFKKVDNPCPLEKIDEKKFENIDNL